MLVAEANILIVEDEQLLNEAYQAILEKQGYKVTVAFDGDEALIKARKSEPDLILLDLRMPRVNGIEFLEAYDISGSHPKVKVVVFSNLDAQQEIDRAYELGAQKYVLKAWASPKDLVQLVKEMLAPPAKTKRAKRSS